MLDSDIRKEWVDALRSGLYLQGQNALRTDDSFCCLGVLCDLLPWLGWKERLPDSGKYAVVTTGAGYVGVDMTGYPPTQTLTEIGLTQDACEALVRLNDSDHTFAEIADVIENEEAPDEKGALVAV